MFYSADDNDKLSMIKCGHRNAPDDEERCLKLCEECEVLFSPVILPPFPNNINN